MKKSQRLNIIIDLQSQQESQALQMLGACQRQRQEMEAQLQNLKNYRQEYREKYDALKNRGLSISQLLEFRAFIDKLDKAIEAQGQTVEAKGRELVQFRKNWEQKHQKTKSMQKMSAQAASDEAKLVNKREQAEQDERASRFPRKNGMRSA
ncbi:flagellar export protein FliJ [Methylomarinum sp. Ch1-1]|uniref:Flagellar FliJ protein n=1 Tax=Methylomarinum roseum TaxID=3067653 RepID=A0AAU7NUL8_9GAMM|nr:flagellar export protein FliJ [Methylomarinum sp. Ch1-1]MDP4519626.1 flagellar export protein FliJ [Methylomarinum sp. Ch1-1]